jgi:hypothetical protein
MIARSRGVFLGCGCPACTRFAGMERCSRNGLPKGAGPEMYSGKARLGHLVLSLCAQSG